MTDTEAQTKQILRWLKAGHSLTPLEALRKYGCWRLAARVKDLRESGYSIVTTMIDDGEKRYAKYDYRGRAA